MAPDLRLKFAEVNALMEVRREDYRRRRALRNLVSARPQLLTDSPCRDLGDAVFALFCPKDAVILTTNTKDHGPLAEALGKGVQSP